MLHTLPSEIFHLITDKLDFNDKLNLCISCRSLHEKISRTNLYETLKILNNTEDTIRMFQDKILDASQVQVLDIPMDDLPCELYSSLADIFPNVTRVITWRNEYLRESLDREDHIIKPLLKWKNSLIKYDAHYDWIYFRNELLYSIFPRLKELALWGPPFFSIRREGFDPVFLLRAIINAPMLTRLYLKWCDINIDSLEVIHNGCPHIRSLEFQYAVLIIDSKTLQSSIIPAYSVLSLKIDVTSSDRYGLFLDYIIFKYPRLRDLDIKFFNEGKYAGRLGDYDSTYRINGAESAAEKEQIVQNRVSELRSTIQAYKDKDSVFLSRLPKSIKSVKLQLYILNNVIESLSKANSALSTLKLVADGDKKAEISINPDQLGYIKHLNSLRFLKVSMDKSLQSWGVDFISHTITTLKIRFIDHELDINWILSMFPSLEVLKVKYAGFLVLEKIENDRAPVGKVYPKLRKLDFCNWRACPAPSDFPTYLNYLKMIVPNVEEYRYRLEFIHYDTDELTFDFDFTGWNLIKLDIRVSDPFWRFDNYYMTISAPKGKQQFFRDESEEGYLPVQDGLEFEKERLILNVTCDYIKDCSINGLKFDL